MQNLLAGFFAFQGEKSCISYHFCAQFGKDAIITVKNVKNSLETVVDVMKRIKSILLLLFLLLLGGCHNQPEPKSETIRIALLDTGIAGAAIAPESLLPGWNYLTDTEETEDTVNHGTAVASVIVGCENAGVQGIAPEALLIPLVVADKNATASPEVLAQAIRDGVDKFDADILNISLGSSKNVSEVEQAVVYAEEQGVLVVAAVGNGGSEGELLYPAAYDTVLAVGSINELGEVSAFSQPGADVFAPGEDIWLASRRGKTYGARGTSYATGFVSGLAAGWLANSAQTPADLRKSLCEILRADGDFWQDYFTASECLQNNLGEFVLL